MDTYVVPDTEHQIMNTPQVPPPHSAKDRVDSGSLYSGFYHSPLSPKVRIYAITHLPNYLKRQSPRRTTQVGGGQASADPFPMGF